MTQSDHIRRKVRAELAYREISGRQLAAQIGMTQSALSTRMTGDVEFRISELQAIANFIGVPLSTFLPEPEPSAGVAR